MPYDPNQLHALADKLKSAKDAKAVTADAAKTAYLAYEHAREDREAEVKAVQTKHAGTIKSKHTLHAKAIQEDSKSTTAVGHAQAELDAYLANPDAPPAEQE